PAVYPRRATHTSRHIDTCYIGKLLLFSLNTKLDKLNNTTDVATSVVVKTKSQQNLCGRLKCSELSTLSYRGTKYFIFCLLLVLQ
ncbi:hypothetical protein BgiMline_016195, partial [Biomphalaria glabrata]